MTIFEAIKSRSLEDFFKAIENSNLNEQDTYGRTPLHYVVVQKTPIEYFSELIKRGANIYIEDKLHYTVLDKAIKFQNIPAINVLLETGAKLDHPDGILFTSWYRARHNPVLAGLLVSTKGAFRLTLTDIEKKIVDELLYSEIDLVVKKVDKLNSQVLIHAYVCSFNWDDNIDPILQLIDNEFCSIVTAKEMFDLADGKYWLEKNNCSNNFDKKYVTLIDRILNRFPQIKELYFRK